MSVGAMLARRELVGKVFQLQGRPSGSRYLDRLRGALRAEDGTVAMEVEALAVDDLVTSGVLTAEESAFGEMEVQVNPRAWQWRAASGLLEGRREIGRASCRERVYA
jgi:hypothetical protein